MAQVICLVGWQKLVKFFSEHDDSQSVVLAGDDAILGCAGYVGNGMRDFADEQAC